MKRIRHAAGMLAVIIATVFAANFAYGHSISRQVRLTVTVVGRLSMELDNKWMDRRNLQPKAEAFSELKDRGIAVDKLTREDCTVWLFTKTE